MEEKKEIRISDELYWLEDVAGALKVLWQASDTTYDTYKELNSYQEIVKMVLQENIERLNEISENLCEYSDDHKFEPTVLR